MSGRIFLNYRRADSGPWTLTLRNKLVGHFGEDALFHDLSGVPPGARLREYLAAQVADCVAVIAVIGARWLDLLHERAMASSPDHVRIEIEVALRYGKGIVPVLLGNTRMPTESDLPDSIKELADCAALTLTLEQIDAAPVALIAALTRIIEAAKSEGRIFDSRVGVTAAGKPKLVASGHVISQRVLQVNQGPLRAAREAKMAASGEVRPQDSPSHQHEFDEP